MDYDIARNLTKDKTGNTFTYDAEIYKSNTTAVLHNRTVQITSMMEAASV
jgi:hypothetical protein